jgi:ketosteroid isomerase-like protein
VTTDGDVTTVREFYASFDERPYEGSVATFGARTSCGMEQPARREVSRCLGGLRRHAGYADGSAGTLRLDTQAVLPGADHVIAIHDATAEVLGVEYRAHEVDIFHLRGGRIAEFWSFSEDQEATDRIWSASADTSTPLGSADSACNGTCLQTPGC